MRCVVKCALSLMVTLHRMDTLLLDVVSCFYVAGSGLLNSEFLDIGNCSTTGRVLLVKRDTQYIQNQFLF